METRLRIENDAAGCGCRSDRLVDHSFFRYFRYRQFNVFCSFASKSAATLETTTTATTTASCLPPPHPKNHGGRLTLRRPPLDQGGTPYIKCRKDIYPASIPNHEYGFSEPSSLGTTQEKNKAALLSSGGNLAAAAATTTTAATTANATSRIGQ